MWAIGMCDCVNCFLGIRAMLMNSISRAITKSECGELRLINLCLFMSMGNWFRLVFFLHRAPSNRNGVCCVLSGSCARCFYMKLHLPLHSISRYLQPNANRNEKSQTSQTNKKTKQGVSHHAQILWPQSRTMIYWQFPAQVVFFNIILRLMPYVLDRPNIETPKSLH